MQRERPALGQGERPEIVDEAAEDVRLVEDRGQVRLVCRMDAIDDRLEVALHDGQRCPQLVADIGEQAPPLALVRFEPICHRVEPAEQRADGAGRPPTLVHAHRVIASLDARDGCGEIVERLGHAAHSRSEPEQKEEPKDQDDRADQRHVEAHRRATRRAIQSERRTEQPQHQDGPRKRDEEEQREQAAEGPDEARRTRSPATTLGPGAA